MRRLLCLDGLRGVLACYVMVGHALPFAPQPGWLEWLFQHGGAAVDMFFILSGLVIARSLENYRYRARPFLIARAARIYPVFLVVFVVAVAVQPLPTGFERMPWIGTDSQARFIWSGGWPNDWIVFMATHLTMTHGMFPDSVLPNVWLGFLGSAWSLSTEWQFYLVALLLGERRQTAWLFIAVAIAAIRWNMAAPQSWQFSRAFLPNKAQYFALGIASAAVVKHGQWREYAPALAATLALCALQGGIEQLLPPVAWTACLAMQVRSNMNLAREAAPSPASFSPASWARCMSLAGILQSKPLVWLGSVSYCIYLTNEPIQKLLGVALAMLVHGNGMLFALAWLPASVALPLLASWWLHEWIELPAQRYGRGIALAVNVQ